MPAGFILMPITFTSEFDCADAIIARVGKQLRVATPLAAGKPVPILNALYRRAKEDPGIELKNLYSPHAGQTTRQEPPRAAFSRASN